MGAGFYFVFTGGDPMHCCTGSFCFGCVCFSLRLFTPLPPLPGKYSHSPPLSGVTALII